jgi:hypothetical protein
MLRVAAEVSIYNTMLQTRPDGNMPNDQNYARHRPVLLLLLLLAGPSAGYQQMLSMMSC